MDPGAGAVRNILKERLAAAQAACVMAVRFARSVEIVPMAAASGHHALYVDLQHSALSLDTTSQICIAALGTGLAPLVRVPDHDPSVIGRALDGGALGIIAPDVRCAADARAVVRACRFAPAGERSAITTSAQAGFRTLPSTALSKQLDDATLVIAMVESEQGIAAAGEIASVDGVDAIFIGTSDLSSSMGIPGQFNHERVQAAYRTAIAACRSHGKHLFAGGIRDPAVLSTYVRMGAARCYFTGNDFMFLLNGAKAQVDAMLAADQLVPPAA